jgi:hypothetical protein
VLGLHLDIGGLDQELHVRRDRKLHLEEESLAFEDLLFD